MKSLTDGGLLIKGVSETVENEAKKQRRRFLGLLAVTLGASLLGNNLLGKGVIRDGYGLLRAEKGVIRAGQDF